MDRPANLVWVAPLLLCLVAGSFLTGCEEDTAPVISKFEIKPVCGAITKHTRAVLDDEGNVIGTEDLGDYFEVTYFARATGGNEKPDPTGANTPIDWTWNFGDGTTRANRVSGTHRYTTAGEYTITLQVKDEDGDMDDREVTITVGAEGEDVDILEVAAEVLADAPIGSWVPVVETCPEPDDDETHIVDHLPGFEFKFSGTLDTPCEVSGLTEQYTWSWDFGNGMPPALHESDLSHVLTGTDVTYDVTLTITEESSNTSRSASFQVTTPAAEPPDKPDPTDCPE